MIHNAANSTCQSSSAGDAFTQLGITFHGRGHANPDRLLDLAKRFRRGRRIRRFAVVRRGAAVARCAAVVDERGGKRRGLIGFYAAHDDLDGAKAVLELACEWLAQEGVSEAWGPINVATWHGYRFMTHGFDTKPFLGEPRNPRYYPLQFTACGFEPVSTYRSWDVEPKQMAQLASAAASIPPEAARSVGLWSRPVNLEDWNGELERLHPLLSRCFDKAPGFTPIGLAEFRAAYAPMESLLVPQMTRLVFDRTDNVVGFGHSYPDPLSGRAVLHTIALLPRVRRMGVVEGLLLAPAFKYMVSNIGSAVGGLTREGRTLFDKIGTASREYTLYRRTL